MKTYIKKFLIPILLLMAVAITDVLSQGSGREYLYVTTDRNIWFAAEEIMFKIWYFNEEDVADSRTVYFEILTRDNIPIVQKKLKLTDGMVSGSVSVPVDVSSGYYILRCYTNYMKNFGAESFFHRKIIFMNPVRSEKFNFGSEIEESQDPEVTFHPEATTIKQYLRNRVFVRLNNFPADLELNGNIISENSDTLAKLNMLNDELGVFDFVPGTARSFLVFDGVRKRFSLPASKDEGLILSFTELLDDYRITLHTMDSSFFQKSLVLDVLSVDNNKTTIVIKDKMMLSKAQLFEGVNQIIVKDEAGKILAENYIYRNPLGRLVINADFNKREFGVREQVKISVKTTNRLNQARSADLNIRVVKSHNAPTDNFDIASYLDIFRYSGSEMPSWDINDRKVFDAFLTLYGPGMFKLYSNSGKFPKEYNGSVVTGKLNGMKDPGNRPVFMSVVGDSAILFTGITNSDGSFIFPVSILEGEKNIIIKSDDRIAEGKFSMDEDFSNQYKEFENFPAYFESTFINKINEFFYAWQVNQLYGTNALSGDQPCVRKYKFYGEPDFMIEMKNFVELPVMEEVFFELVKPVMVLRRDKTAYLKVIERTTNRTLDENILFLVDGVPVFDVSYIMDMEPSAIASIAVVARLYFLGPFVFDGIVDISTKKGNFSEFDLNSAYLRRTVLFPENASQITNLPSGQDVNDDNIPDFRNLLYWNPQVKTNEKGEAEISFYTSDDGTEYDVIIEGVDAESNPGHIKYKIKIQTKNKVLSGKIIE